MVKSPDKLVHRQELEVWYVIPAIRKALAQKMKSKGLEQRKIAEILGVTESAISQYTNEKRASDLEFSLKIEKEVSKSAEKITKSPPLLLQEIQRLLSLKEMKAIICKMHKLSSCVPSQCDACGLCFH